MRGIASRLGVSATALYQHFESKASILREIRVYGLDLLHDSLKPAFEQTDIVERMRDITRRYIQFARGNPWLYSVLMEHDQLEWDRMSQDDIKFILRPLGLLKETMAAGREAGVWRDDISIELASFRVWASVHGLCSLLNNGRFSEKHPAFPIPDEKTLIDAFADGVISTLTK